MKVKQLVFKQYFNKDINEIWDFFSSPLNLERITPKNMAFIVTSESHVDTKMYPGMIITYKVAPLLNIKLNWVTEITEVAKQKYFIDEQRFGPFKFWHHQHHFETKNGGTEMTDILTYAMPFGIFGTIAHELMVKNRLNQIFEFRKTETERLFKS